MTNDDSTKLSNLDSTICIGKEDVKLLLTLLHVAGCNKNETGCKILPDCADIRLLYEHIKTCKDNNNCNRDKCYIGRVLLSHYSKCQQYNCTFCLPSRLSLHNRNVYTTPQRRRIVTTIEK